jgi:hypothetical protein
MNHFINFDPYTIGEHNRQMRTQIDSLRLQEQLRKDRKVRGSSRPFVLVKRGRLRTTSPDGFVQESQAGGGKTLWRLP